MIQSGYSISFIYPGWLWSVITMSKHNLMSNNVLRSYVYICSIHFEIVGVVIQNIQKMFTICLKQ